MKRRIKGLGWLVTIALAGILASLAVDQDPIKGLIGSAAVRLVLKLFALCLSSGAGVFSYYRSERRYQESTAGQARKEAVAHLEDMLASSIQNLFLGERPQTIRANVMLAEDDELHMLASANMLVFPDYRVSLRKGQGCAGLAWEHAVGASMNDCWKPVFASKAQLTPALLKRKWKLTEEQIDQTAHILWILSIPLFQKVGSSRKFIGVLNFDGVHQPLRSSSRLTQPDFIGQCVAIGGRIAEVAAEAMAVIGQVDSQPRRRVLLGRPFRRRQ